MWSYLHNCFSQKIVFIEQKLKNDVRQSNELIFQNGLSIFTSRFLTVQFFILFIQRLHVEKM